MTSTEIWILGATGRSGRATAAELGAAGADVVLGGREAGRLAAVGPYPTVVAGSPAEFAAAVRDRRPAVVLNTVGPFSTSAPPLLAACLSYGGHYLDLGNDVETVLALLGRQAEAEAAASTFVTGVGFGVLATEAVVVELCAGRPAPSRVHVDALAALDLEAGPIGDALAATILDGARAGGRSYAGGRPVRSPTAGARHSLTLPGGEQVRTADLATGELVAAWNASRAPAVTAASGLAPQGRLVRAALPVASLAVRVPAVHRFATRRLSRVQLPAQPMVREHSWGHAVVEWPTETREGWLRAGDASSFTVGALTQVALRLARGGGRPGAFTPAVAFGADVAVAAGGTFVEPGTRG